MGPNPSLVQKPTNEQALATVAARIASCEACVELCRACLTPVPGEGDPEADIMFVGEAPGAQEDRVGRPFVGASGKFLATMLETIGLTRDDVFITNIVKYRPPANRDPTAQEIQACLPYLMEQIDIIRPKLIVFLGRHSMSVFYPQLKIGEVHGEPITGTYIYKGETHHQVYLPLYHPAAALYNGSMRQTLLEDFQRIPGILATIS